MENLEQDDLELTSCHRHTKTIAPCRTKFENDLKISR